MIFFFEAGVVSCTNRHLQCCDVPLDFGHYEALKCLSRVAHKARVSLVGTRHLRNPKNCIFFVVNPSKILFVFLHTQRR